MFCHTCGNSIGNDEQICSMCGTVVRAINTSNAQITPTVPNEESAVQIQTTSKVLQKQQIPDLRTLQGDVLVRCLTTVLDPLIEMERLDEEIKKTHQKVRRIGSHCVWFYYWPFFALGWLVFYFLIIMMSAVLGSIVNEVNASAVFGFIVIFSIFFVILFNVGGLILAIKLHKKSAEKAKNNQEIVLQHISDMKDRQVELYMSVGNILDMIPQDYRYHMAVNYFVDSLKKGRAESMKEAINLYEEQLHRWKLENAAMEAVALQHQQAASLRSIKASSNVTAVASTANVIYNILK